MKYPRILPYGDAAILVEFGDVVDQELNTKVNALDQQLTKMSIHGVLEMMPTFRSLMIRFDPLETDHKSLEKLLTPKLNSEFAVQSTKRKWRFPVCYHQDFGLDINEVSKSCGLSIEEVGNLHCRDIQQTYMIGFLPGHPYLGDLPPELMLPRRPDPRLQVPRGSVGIANGLSVIYPVDCPGGWNIIGKTPVPLFSFESETPCLLAPGDEVQFQPISLLELEGIEKAVAAGEWAAIDEALQ